MVVLVTGANGQLGQSLQFIAPNYPEIQFHFLNSAELDVSNLNSIASAFKQVKPHFCINAAAYTAVDKAESETDKAHLINTIGPRNIAEACRSYDTTLLHISTDFVFDGNQNTPYTEEDLTNPQGVYGTTKRDGELEIIQATKAYFIIRTSWLYSQFGNNFMKTMLRLGNEKTELNVVNDQIGTPTHAVDLAEILVKIIKSNSQNYGVYHFSNEGSISWYDFAQKIFTLNKVAISLHPIPTSQYPTPAKRPMYSVLDKFKIKTEFKTTIPTWDKSLVSHLNQ